MVMSDHMNDICSSSGSKAIRQNHNFQNDSSIRSWFSLIFKRNRKKIEKVARSILKKEELFIALKKIFLQREKNV